MRYFVNSSSEISNEIQILEKNKLGRGATATVFSVIFEGKEFAAKIYHSDRSFDIKKIQAMLDNPPGNTEVIQSGQDYPQIAWPISIIKNKLNNDVGFLLPLVDTTESFTLDHYYDQGLFKKLNSADESALSYKLEIARNLSKIVAELHSHHHYFVDCKPQNIRVFKRNHVVTLIDCDGFSIQGNQKRFPAELLSTDYIAPEAQTKSLSPTQLGEDQDRYALAVILFQLLNRGTHPFQGIITDSSITCSTNDEKASLGLYPYGIIRDLRIKPRPQSTHHLWDIESRRLFDQAFTNTQSGKRPSAQQWADHFESLLVTKTLVRCEKFSNDLTHIRFRDMACPTCYLSGLQTFSPSHTITKNRPISNSNNSNQTTPPNPIQTNTSNNSSSGFWLVASAIAIVLLIVLFNSGKKEATVDNPPPVLTMPTDPNKQPVSVGSDGPVISTDAKLQVNSKQFIALYASNSRAIGYSIGNSTESDATSDGYQQCLRQIKGSDDSCVLVLSGQGKCLAISRSSDGGLGAAIGESPMNTASDAQNSCRTNGGTNCPYPTETIFCAK